MRLWGGRGEIIKNSLILIRGMGGGRRGGALIHTRFSPQQRQEIGLPEVAGDWSTGNGRRLLYQNWHVIGLPEVA